jgi:hypothetical protein
VGRPTGDGRSRWACIGYGMRPRPAMIARLMSDEAPEPRPGFLRRRVLYPGPYSGFVLVSALDLLLTWRILVRGGRELNWIADRVIEYFGRGGIVAFKFTIVVLVIITCELVGRHSRRLGLFLIMTGIILPSCAVVAAVVQLVRAR